MTDQPSLPTGSYAVCSSGGKDSLLAYDRALQAGRHIVRLVTLYDGATGRVRFHGVPIPVLHAQADALELPLSAYPTTPETFEDTFLAALADLRADGIEGVLFGNIHLAEVRAWYETRVRQVGLEHVEPLWGEAPGRLVREVLARGFSAVLTGIEVAKVDPAWLGQPLSESLIAACEQRGIDPCGEFGEYHTLVTDGPRFRHPLSVQLGDVHGDGDPTAQGRFRQIDVHMVG